MTSRPELAGVTGRPQSIAERGKYGAWVIWVVLYLHFMFNFLPRGGREISVVKSKQTLTTASMQHHDKITNCAEDRTYQLGLYYILILLQACLGIYIRGKTIIWLH